MADWADVINSTIGLWRSPRSAAGSAFCHLKLGRRMPITLPWRADRRNSLRNN
jgi:hypothetical protein